MTDHDTVTHHSNRKSIATLLNNQIGRQSAYVFLLLMIMVVIPVTAQSNTEDRFTVSPLPDAVKNESNAAIAADISTKDIVEKEISTREQKLKKHPLSLDDSRSTKVNSNKFMKKHFTQLNENE